MNQHGLEIKVYMTNCVCKKCKSVKTIKAGKIKGRQRYKCKICKKTFVPGEQKSINTKKKKEAIELYLEGMSIRGIGRYLGVSHTTIINWIKEMAEKLRPVLPLHAEHIEIDELYFYLKSKKIKRYLWAALCRHSKRILGFQVGGRGKITFKKLYYKILPIETKKYFTDDHAPYKVLPKEKHSTKYGQTNSIESFWSSLRHFTARFRRKGKCYTKSEAMVEATMNLFMYKQDRKYFKMAA